MGDYPEDGRYPPIAYKTKTDDDLIDFPVSNMWLNFYQEQGLTPRYVPQENIKTARELKGEIHDLEERIRALEEHIFHPKEAKERQGSQLKGEIKPKPKFRGIERKRFKEKQDEDAGAKPNHFRLLP